MACHQIDADCPKCEVEAYEYIDTHTNNTFGECLECGYSWDKREGNSYLSLEEVNEKREDIDLPLLKKLK